jgi:DNA primase
VRLDRIDVADFLAALGVNVEARSGDNLLFKCPWHSDTHPSARMNIKTTAWLCSVGCGKGNAVNFLAMLKGMEFADAEDHIALRYGIGPGAAIDDLELEVRRNLGLLDEPQMQRVPPDEAWVDYLAIDWEVAGGHPAATYMADRGFDADVLRRWQIGFDTIGQRVTIPVRDRHGVLVGFKGRAIDPAAHVRYLVLGDNNPEYVRYGFHTYRKSEHVFGLDRIPDHVREIYVVEGELNTIAMMEYHEQWTVGIAGVEFSETQRELIASRFDRAVVMLDDDELKVLANPEKINAGRRGAAKVVSKLLPFMDVEVVLHAYDDPVDYIGRDMSALLTSARPGLELGVRGELDLVLQT